MAAAAAALIAAGDLKLVGGETANRLKSEKSPYLLQHANNPVDWYPWGPEAFEKARKEDKPIFLSIGYSTCHWCHVMERESFEDLEVARLMNQAFVSIKVDREERPDIDSVYMQVCNMMTGSGGWPLTIIMTPDKRPFFAGTYIPKGNRFGRTGMLELIPRIRELWRTKRKDLLDSANRISDLLKQPPQGEPGRAPDEATLKLAFEQLSARYDAREGGFSRAPKFPTPHNLTFLLRYWKRTGEKQALEMTERTLRAMRRGGIYDQVGFGFHRYSTDSQWLVPHFEKMLYDQALAVVAYTEAYQATGRKEYARTAAEISDYVLRDMTASEGGFYSAEDADSEGEEGKFYVWTRKELQQILGKDQADLAVKVFNVKASGENILHLGKSHGEAAADIGLSERDFLARMENIRQRLFEAREKRVHPHKDDKILTDWNGLMIAALAKAGRVLDEPRYILAAARASDFILQNMRDAGGRFFHRYRDGEAAVSAYLDDYAFFVWGLLELYETSFEARYLETALKLNQIVLEDFRDDKNGGFYFTSENAEDLLVRPKEIYDGAVPSGNSVMMLNLLRLGRVTGNTDFEKEADGIGRAFSTTVERAPSGVTQLMAGLDFALGPAYEVIIVGRPEAEDTKAMLKALRAHFVPNKVVLLRPSGLKDPWITRLAKFTEYHSSINGKATAYVCVNYQCEMPTTDVSEMLGLLGIGKGK